MYQNAIHEYCYENEVTLIDNFYQLDDLIVGNYYIIHDKVWAIWRLNKKIENNICFDLKDKYKLDNIEFRKMEKQKIELEFEYIPTYNVLKNEELEVIFQNSKNRKIDNFIISYSMVDSGWVSKEIYNYHMI